MYNEFGNEKDNKIIIKLLPIFYIFVIVCLGGIFYYKYIINDTDKIDVINLNVSIKYGETYQIELDLKDIVHKWESSNPSLISVDDNGKLFVNINQDGEAIIKAITEDEQVLANVIVEVLKSETVIHVNGIKLEKKDINLKYGESEKLIAIISPSNATNKSLIWTSSNPSLVGVDNNGYVVTNTNKDGQATITVKTVDGNHTDSAMVKVEAVDKVNKVSGIKLDTSQVTLKYGQTIKVVATILPSNATNNGIIWTSSNSNVATVDSDGTVTVVGGGNTTITATTVDGNYKATCTITVDRKLYTVTFDSNGGSSVASQSILEGGKIVLPSEPKKQGYIFNGWLLNNSKYNFNSTVTSNVKLTASWKTDYNAVDYCSSMPTSYEKDGVKLKNCIKNFVISMEASQKNRFMQNFSITSNYIYFSSPLNGAWMSGYSSSDLEDTQKYNSIIDSSKFEKISSVFIARVDKASGNSKLNEIKYSGHGQGLDTISGDTDSIYLTSIANPISYNELIGAGSSGISYTTFKEAGGVRVPGVTVVFNSDGAVYDRITSTEFMENGVFNSTSYFQTIKEYSKNSLMRKKISSMAIDEKNDRLAYSVGKKVYIYSLSKVKNGTATEPIKEISAVSNQGLELNGDNLYIVTNSGTIISIHKYNISTGKKTKTVEMDLGNLYKNRIEQGNGIEAEGLSIYNGKLYVGIVSRENKVGYNDIYLVENFS